MGDSHVRRASHCSLHARCGRLRARLAGSGIWSASIHSSTPVARSLADDASPLCVRFDRRVQDFLADPRSYAKPYKETVLAMGLQAKLYIAAIYLVSTVFMLPLPVLAAAATSR